MKHIYLKCLSYFNIDLFLSFTTKARKPSNVLPCRIDYTNAYIFACYYTFTSDWLSTSTISAHILLVQKRLKFKDFCKFKLIKIFSFVPGKS